MNYAFHNTAAWQHNMNMNMNMNIDELSMYVLDETATQLGVGAM